MKNSRFRPTRFFAYFHRVSNIDATCPAQAMTASHIAEPMLWPTPWPKTSTASQWVIFSTVLAKTGVFQQYQSKFDIGDACGIGPKEAESSHFLHVRTDFNTDLDADIQIAITLDTFLKCRMSFFGSNVHFIQADTKVGFSPR